MKKRILVTARTFGKIAKEPLGMFPEGAYELVWNPYGRPPQEEEYRGLIRGIAGLIVGGEKVPASALEAADELRVISVHGVGTDNIDLKVATERGILVCNAPGANTNAVAELALGLMLASARLIPFADREVKSGRWGQCIGIELAGKVLGIVGLGKIGQSLARKAKALGMEVVAYDILLDADFLKAEKIEALPLDELLSRSDFVSLNCPLTPQTEDLIGEDRLKKMRKTAHLINVSRGRVVNEQALEKALREGWIAGAATDVYSMEPPVGSPLLSLEGLVTTMHMGAHTHEALAEMGRMAAQNVLDALEGRRPQFLVNSQVWERIGA
ncbi:MAG: phosphoglycerate dehydrogenase [candidate division NC10 bacterium]|nr:phosphoglycerate dehydrogenase [candidate division NC10 bacterium]